MRRYLDLEIVLLSLLLVFSIFTVTTGSRASQQEEAECSPEETSCGGGLYVPGPEIRFPFFLAKKNHSDHLHPNRCGYPGFGLSCSSQGETLLSFSAAQEPLVVEDITYESQKMYVSAADNCLPRRLLQGDLNLTDSPFHFESLGNYTIFNCSRSALREELMSTFSIQCLSVPSGNQVYAFHSHQNLRGYPLSHCKKMKSLQRVPSEVFSADEYEGVALQWSLPNCAACEVEGRRCTFKNSTARTVECYGSPHKNSLEGETSVTPPVEFYRPPHNKDTIMEKLKMAGFLGSFLVVSTAIGCYHHFNADKIEEENRAKIEKFLENYRALRPTRYSYADIKKITHQFRNKLGQGGFGTVFKGKLSDEIFVAVKVLKTTDGDGEEFINEVGTMGRIHHVNVVRMVGFCADGLRRALVYDFLPNASLEKFIFSESVKKALGWSKLKDIALGVARGIEYLHQGCDKRILHFDIKPHNILLDHNFDPKVSDFGLAKLYSKEQSIVSMTAARGTIGYIAPEVFSRNFGSVSHKSDVYSFGMLLLDIVEGRRDTGAEKESSSQGYFPDWIYSRMERGEVVGTAIDTVSDADIARQLTVVGLWCIQWYPMDRPSMKDAIQMLEGEGESLTMPPNPFSSTNPSKEGMRKRGRDLNTELAIISESESD